MKECTVCQSCFPDSAQTCDRDGSPVKTTLPIDPLINGRYHLKKRVGGGSVSVVYLANEDSAGIERAVKIILPDAVGHSASVAERFLGQAKEAFALRHPNIVNVTDSGLIDGLLPFIVVDFIPAASLKEVLSGRGPLAPAEALEYVSAIGEGLEFAHARGIFHGDLKPRNILVQHERPVAEAIRIADFGLSVIKSGKIHEATQGQGSGILRSPLYLAPEEWSEEESDARSDIYSLGVILYQMLTGQVPFKGKSIPAIMKAHLMEPPPRIAGRFPEISADVETVVLHALEKDPAKRPQTVESFVEEFRTALNDEAGAVDFDKTIVLTNASFDVVDHADAGDDLRQPDFEMTIVNGLAEDEVDEVAEEFEEEFEEDVEVGPKPLLGALQPFMLAAGVVLVIVLIGIGIYYSRMSQ